MLDEGMEFNLNFGKLSYLRANVKLDRNQKGLQRN